MVELKIRKDWCKACGYCVEMCPKKVLGLSPDLNIRGVHHAVVNDITKCTGCTICALVCPDVAIEIFGDGRER